MSVRKKLCFCVPMPWAALIAEIIFGLIGVITVAFGGVFQYNVISQIDLPTYIAYMTVYAPLVLLSIMGTIAVMQGNANGLRININMYYINIALIFIVDVVNIIIMATARRDAIVETCRISHLKKSSNISYLINPIGTAISVNTGCRDYWIKFVLYYVVGFLVYLIIMMLCILTLRTYRGYLLDHHKDLDEEFGLRKSHVDSYPYTPESIYSEKHSHERPEIKYKQAFEAQDNPSSLEVQTEYYKSRPELYSKISHKKDLRRKSLTVPSIASGGKSPTLERMDYERFKGRRSSNIPLERESSISNYHVENPSASTQDLGDSESNGLLHDSTR